MGLARTSDAPHLAAKASAKQQEVALLQWVQVESTPLDTTGGHTWRAAYRLADFLEAMAAQLCLSQPGGVTLLELGSGCGWLGCTLARNLPPSSLVVLTEQAGGLEWLAHNLHRNAGRRLPGLGSVRVQACDWLQFAPPGFEWPASGGDSCSDSGTAVGEQREQQQRGCHSLEEAGGQASPASASASAVEGAAAARPGSGEAEAPALDLHSVEWDFIVGSDLIYNQVWPRLKGSAPTYCAPRALGLLLSRVRRACAAGGVALPAARAGGAGGAGHAGLLRAHKAPL